MACRLSRTNLGVLGRLDLSSIRIPLHHADERPLPFSLNRHARAVCSPLLLRHLSIGPCHYNPRVKASDTGDAVSCIHGPGLPLNAP